MQDFRRSCPLLEEMASRRSCCDANRFSRRGLWREKQSTSRSQAGNDQEHNSSSARLAGGLTASGGAEAFSRSRSSHMAGQRLKHGIWVLVADGEKALFLRNEGDAEYPNLQVVRELHEENPATRDQGTDRPGRLSDGPSAHRSAVADTDWH